MKDEIPSDSEVVKKARLAVAAELKKENSWVANWQV